MANSTMRAAERVTGDAEHVFQEEFGFSLTADETTELTNAIYRIFNAAIVAEKNEPKE